MADHRRRARDHRGMIAEFGNEMPREQHRDRALRAVEDQGRRRQLLAPGAPHIGRADIARPDLAQVARAEQSGQDDAARDRTQQITRARSEEPTSELPSLMRLSY